MYCCWNTLVAGPVKAGAKKPTGKALGAGQAPAPGAPVGGGAGRAVGMAVGRAVGAAVGGAVGAGA